MNVYTKKQNVLWPRLPSNRGSSTKSGQKILTKGAILLALIIFLNVFQHPIRNYFFLISSPLSKTFSEAGINASNFFSSFTIFTSIKKENNNLKEENQKLLSQLSSLQQSLKDNQELKNAIENTKDNNFSIVLSKVIGIDSENDMLVIDKGSDDGILENMPVISGEKALYGKVLKAYKNFSHVMLISNKNSVLDVKIQQSDPAKSPVYGAVKGDGGLSVYLDLVNSDAEIKQGDVLVTSALEGTFPLDLLVGKITSINKNDAKPFQTAPVQPFFDIKSTDALFIINNYQQTK